MPITLFLLTGVVIFNIVECWNEPLKTPLVKRLSSALSLLRSPVVGQRQKQTTTPHPPATFRRSTKTDVLHHEISGVAEQDTSSDTVTINNNDDGFTDDGSIDDQHDQHDQDDQHDKNDKHDQHDIQNDRRKNMITLLAPPDSSDERLHSDIDAEMHAFDHAGGFLQIPNVTLRKQLFNEMISTALQNHANVKFGIPLKQIINATVNNGVFPTMVPNQTQQFPSLERDIYCNPALMPGGCATLTDWGRAIGIPLRNKLINSQIASLFQRLGGTANLLHEKLTRGFTASFIDFIEMDGHVQQIESIARNLSQIVPFDRNRDILPQLISNLSSLLIFDNGLIADRDMVLHAFKTVMRDKVKAAALCRLSNGRLPNCDAPLPETPSTWPGTGSMNSLGFYDYVAVHGYSYGCSVYRGCIQGDKRINASQFDGLYYFADVDSATGFPIYWKPFESEQFQNIHSLVLWRKSFQGPNTELISKTGIYAAITPNQPNFDDALFGSRAPFAFRFGAADNPSTCGTNPQNFPQCMEDDNQWVLARYSSAHRCSGSIYSSRVCQWRIPHVHFHGSGVPINVDLIDDLPHSNGNSSVKNDNE